MTYFLLRQDARREYFTALGVSGVEREVLCDGAPIVGTVQEPVQVTISAWGDGYSDLLERPCFVVSDAMRDALERAGVDNIEYFAAELHIEFREEPLDGYWLANVIGMVACVDSERSTFEPSYGSELGELRGFEVDLAKSCDLSLFRLAEDPRLVVVHERVRAALQAARLRGLIFQDTQSYDGYSVSSEEEPEEPDA